MSRMKKIIAFGVVAALGACALACLVVALSLVYYRPAVVAASGHEMRWPTRPGLLGSVSKRIQVFMEIRPCDYMVLGWSAEGVLFYQEACQDNFQVWAYDPAKESKPYRVEAVPTDLLQEIVPRRSVLNWVQSPGVRPADVEPMVRNLEIRADGLASPDGRWVAVVVRHIYGPEDVIVLEMVTTSVPPTQVFPETLLPASTIVTPPSACASHMVRRTATFSKSLP